MSGLVGGLARTWNGRGWSSWKREKENAIEQFLLGGWVGYVDGCLVVWLVACLTDWSVG